MLQITIPGGEMWDEVNEVFIYAGGQPLQLEHSLVSLSKWESKWFKPFLSQTPKSNEEITDYIRCMTLTQNVNPDVYNYLTDENVDRIQHYIDAPMTATTFSKDPSEKGGRATITAEIIYYWMITFNIPFECQKWHLNRLLTLIRVCDRKSRPGKKMSKREIMSRNAALNRQRRAMLKSKG